MIRYYILLIIILINLGCNRRNQQEMNQNHQYTNALIHETSPYLLQHAHNPVNWHPWNEETLEKAKQENKLILISVGYAACHWCHVMEKESFEDSTVAAVMNEHFINIKVDREERPDVDQVYMNAVQLLTGSGGWPLNCVALPDGRPIWGGTYFPKDNWLNALEKLADLYKNEPEKAEEYAAQLTEGIHQSGLITLNETPPNFTKIELDTAITRWQNNFDLKNGGHKGAPKFPMPTNISLLLRYAKQTGNSSIQAHVNTTLTQMAYGGIYDQIGGGFARYAVDPIWHIPHFEKMLYDNAQLISLYSKAYAETKKPLYQQIVFETISFVERELYNGNGAFYSSLDADSQNESGELEEGAYYVWTKNELEDILDKDFDIFSDYYNVNLTGKWEGDKYHLIRTASTQEIAQKHNLSTEELNVKIKHWKETLLAQREQKDKPRLDDKSLTSWNALMLTAYVDAYTVFQKEEFLNMALKNAQFIVNEQWREDGGLNRNFKNGNSTIEAYLEDYAHVINAFLQLYQVTLDENWLQNAKQLTDYCFDHFYNSESKMFFFTSDLDAALITRKMETEDNVIPSSNSVMAHNLFLLGHYFYNKTYSDTAKSMLNNLKGEAINYAGGFSNWLQLYMNYVGNFYEVAISGKEALTKLKEIESQYIPNKLIVGSTKDSDLPLLESKFSKSETTIYVCVDGACQLPVTETHLALKQIKTEL